MATKTANVNSRMKLDIKQQAESILDRLGVPRVCRDRHVLQADYSA